MNLQLGVFLSLNLHWEGFAPKSFWRSQAIHACIATNAHLPFWQFSSFHLRYGEGKWAIILSNKRDTFEDRTAVLIVSAYFYFLWFSLSDLMTSYFMNRCIWRISGEIWPGINFVLHFARSPWLHGMSFYHIAHYGWKPHICR